MGKRTLAVIIFLSFVFWFFALAALYPQAYPITEPELSRLETIWQQSQADKQNWLSQVQKLKMEASQLKTDSITLNSQLSLERQATDLLRISSEKLEAEKNSIILSKQNEIENLTSQKNTLLIKQQKLIKQRDILVIIILMTGIVCLVLLAYRFRKLFGLP